MPKNSNPHGGWGGPGRGGGAYPKDPAAATKQAIQTARRRLALLRKLGTMPYAERLVLFQHIDAFHEEAEVFLCEAPDYTSQNNDE